MSEPHFVFHGHNGQIKLLSLYFNLQATYEAEIRGVEDKYNEGDRHLQSSPLHLLQKPQLIQASFQAQDNVIIHLRL